MVPFTFSIVIPVSFAPTGGIFPSDSIKGRWSDWYSAVVKQEKRKLICVLRLDYITVQSDIQHEDRLLVVERAQTSVSQNQAQFVTKL